VAIVGAGRMGGAMAARLQACGAEVTIFNRTRATAEQIAAATGVTVVDTAAEAAASAPVVLVSLADDAACVSTYSGADGVAAGVQPGAVVVETSTIDPRTVDELTALLDGLDVGLLDAPVSGSVPLVERGELTAIVGGSAGDLARARSVIELLASKVFHVGDRGAGATIKLAVNSIVHATNQAVAEALVLAEKAGVERSAAYEVFANSAITSPFVQYKRDAFEHPDAAPVTFSLGLVAKDYDLIASLAERVGAVMRQATTGRQTVSSAIDAGYGDCDMSALAALFRSTVPADVSPTDR
jgi:3-hydroxyisobutyrate dehydrogenase-like beta-hydroxyacid dehydrogenase